MTIDTVVQLIVYVIQAIQAVAGSYAGLKLVIYGVGYMRKNPQKIEEAKEGIKNVGIGFAIVMGGQGIVTWLQAGLGF